MIEMCGKGIWINFLRLFLLTLVLKQTLCGTCSLWKRNAERSRKKEPELKLTFNYGNKIYKLFYIQNGSPLHGKIHHCTSNEMEMAFINSKKMVGDISDILKNNQVICEIAIGGYAPKQSKTHPSTSWINWESIVKERNLEVHIDCLAFSDWDRKKQGFGGPVYRLCAGAKYCEENGLNISQFLCEKDLAKSSTHGTMASAFEAVKSTMQLAQHNTNASITTTVLSTLEQNTPLGQKYTAISLLLRVGISVSADMKYRPI